jgi:hypothetical protein
MAPEDCDVCGFGVETCGALEAGSRVRMTTAKTRPRAMAPQNQSDPRDWEVSEVRGVCFGVES